MTSNQVQHAANKEAARANREKEKLARDVFEEDKKTNRSKRAKNYTDVAKSAAGAAASIGSLIAAANDPAWYNGNPAAARDAASLSMLTPIGVPNKENGIDATVPGILKYAYAPVLPHRDGSVDSVWYRSFQSTYMDVRKANSGAKNWTIANLAQWALSTQSILTLWVEAYRAYSAILHYSTRNRYYGRALCEACGFDPEDMENNLSQYRYFLNLMRAQIAKTIPFPQTMPWFKRSIWLAGNVFSDDQDTDHGHLSVFVPEIYYQYGDVELFSKAVARPTLPYTYQTFTDQFYTLYDAIIYSEDAGTMAGDIMKAFPNEYDFKLPEVTVDPISPIVYSELVNSQIRNAVPVPFLPDLNTEISAFHITEDSVGTLSQPLSWTESGIYALGTLGNTVSTVVSHKSDPKPEEVLEMIMMMHYGNIDVTSATQGSTAISYEVTDCMTEIVLEFSTFKYTRNSEEEALSVIENRTSIITAAYAGINSNAKFIEYVIQPISDISNWQTGPTRFYLRYEDANDSRHYMLVNTFGTRGWIANINEQVYRNMAATAVASMLGLGT